MVLPTYYPGKKASIVKASIVNYLHIWFNFYMQGFFYWTLLSPELLWNETVKAQMVIYLSIIGGNQPVLLLGFTIQLYYAVKPSDRSKL